MMSAHDGHDMALHVPEPPGHSDHDGENVANPCCSACGPTLAETPACIIAPQLVMGDYSTGPERPVPSLEAVRSYLATGPPISV